MWKDDDKLLEYDEATRKSILEFSREGASIGASIGRDFGSVGEAIGRSVGGVIGGVIGGVMRIFFDQGETLWRDSIELEKMDRVLVGINQAADSIRSGFVEKSSKISSDL